MLDEEQVCTFKSAKRLKELKVAQEGELYWVMNTFINKYFLWSEKPLDRDWISAFSEDELDKLLPSGCEVEENTRGDEKVWCVWEPIDWSNICHPRLVEAKAKALIHILELNSNN